MSTAYAINIPFPVFPDVDGNPLDAGYIYIGTANQNPETNPISVYWDAAMSTPAAQPIRTSGGFPVRNGSPSRLYVAANFSITVRNKNGSFVYSAANVTDLFDSSFISFTQAGTGAQQQSVQTALRDMMVSVRSFGAVGDGITDDTASINAAIDYCNANEKTIFFPGNVSGTYKVTAALNLITTTGGVEMEAVGYDYTSKGVVEVVGSGFTAVTVSGKPTRFNLAVAGTGNTANGILFQNPAGARVGKIRAMQLDGFGVKINKCWDSTFEHIMVELCGNASEYAFSMNDDGDTCNMTHITCVQVEQSNQKAIYISPNTLSCVIDNIHSERQTPASGVSTWILGGNRCLYNALRLSSNEPSSDAKVIFDGAQTQYNAPLVEGSIVTQINANNGNTLTIISPEFQGPTGNYPNQNGTVNIFGGSIGTFTCDPTGFKVRGTKINTLTVGWAGNDPKSGSWESCLIETLASSSTQSAATFVNCVINTHGNLLEGTTVLRGCTVNNVGATTLSVAYRTMRVYDSIINAPVNIDNGTIFGYDTRFTSTLSQSSGAVTSLFNDGCFADDVVSGLGVVTGGASSRGMYTKNMAPAAGSPKGWICTVAGAPGTWVSTGNL